jgi:hypothetical protein
MNKKSGGPVSAAGKAISSKNAIKHGATTTGFINDQEEVRYNSLLNDLKAHYKFDNPLIKLQLERIGKVTVQLERMQNIIGATFQKCRAEIHVESKLMGELNMSADQQLAVTLDKLLPDNTDEKLEGMILAESIGLSLSKPETFEDLMKYAPTICQDIYNNAIKKEKSVKDYVNGMIKKFDSTPNQYSNYDIRVLPPNGVKKPTPPMPLEESFLELDNDTLPGLIKWKLHEIHEAHQEKIKLADFKRLLPIAERATTPDLDHLDKLMRYQTTLQRQLSTNIGELIALTKANYM